MTATEEQKRHWRFYKGRPIKPMRKVQGGIQITYIGKYPPAVGELCETAIIQQSDWDQHGERREVASSSIPYIRTLVPTDR
jgi:hypothetical protein